MHGRTSALSDLLVIHHQGERYAIRQDRRDRGTFWMKRTWPNGRRYWRVVDSEAWSQLPQPLRARIIERFLPEEMTPC